MERSQISEVELPGSARAPHANASPARTSGASPENSEQIRYSRRRLPHFERPWAKYAVAFSTYERRLLAPRERDIALDSVLYVHKHSQYELYVACVMPDHVHLLFEPQIKDQNFSGRSIFWSLTEILHGIKSSTAPRINRLRGATGPVWENESFDRLIRSESDLAEKFQYICRNSWSLKVVQRPEHYPWLWTQEEASAGAPKVARELRAGVALRAFPKR